MVDSVIEAERESEDTPTNDTDLIAIIDDCAKDARKVRGDWLLQANECYRFVAGDQFSASEKKSLEDLKRPAVVFNRVEPVVNVVAGLEVTNRQEVRYLPREAGDAKPNEIFTGAAEWVRDECNAEDEESEAFYDMTITGEGWIETRLDYEYDQDGMVAIERVDPREMLPDPGSTKKNYKDAEYLIRERMVSLRWVKDTWPEKEDEIDLMTTDGGSMEFDGERHANVVGDQYRAPKGVSGQGSTKKLVKLTEYQYKKREPYYRIEDPNTGQIAELTPEQHSQVQRNAQAVGLPPLKSVKQKKCVYYRAYKIGNVLLENNKNPDPNSFGYHAMTAKRDVPGSMWYGLVRSMLDPQRWANKFFSQSMFILNTNAKGGVIIEKDAVDKVQDFEDSWARPDKPTWVRSGTVAGNKIQQKQPPAFPPELSKLLDFSIQSIYQVSGVSPEMLGSVQHEQAAVLEYQRKQAGITILATLFDALRKYRKEQGKSLLYLIMEYLTDGRLIRISGEKAAQYVPLTRQPDIAKYDVIIDESPSSPNQKEKTWAILQGLLPMLLQAGIPLPPEVFEYLPLPQSFIDSMKNPDPQKAQEEQVIKQMALAEKQAEIEKTNAEAKKAEAEANAKMVDAQLKAKEIQDGQVDMQNKLAIDMQTAREKSGLELWKAQQQSAIDTWKAQQASELARAQAEFDAKLALRQAELEAQLKSKTAENDIMLSKKRAEGDADAKAAGSPKFEQLQSRVDELIDVIQAPTEIVRDAKTGRAIGARKVRKAA